MVVVDELRVRQIVVDPLANWQSIAADVTQLHWLNKELAARY